MTQIIQSDAGAQPAPAIQPVFLSLQQECADYLEGMEPRFAAMKASGIPATEHIPHQRFWAQANKIIKIKAVQQELACECIF